MFIELRNHPDLKSSGGAKCLGNAGTFRSSGADELFTATSSINIWPLCGRTRFVNRILDTRH